MEYIYLGSERLSATTVAALIRASERAAALRLAMAGEKGRERDITLANAVSAHGVRMERPDEFAPLAVDDTLRVVHKDRGGKRLIYFCARKRIFALGTHFGRESGFSVVKYAADMIPVASELLHPADYNSVVCGGEPAALADLEKTLAGLSASQGG